MTKLYDSQITDILPEYFSDKASVKALAFAVNRVLQKYMVYCSYISVFAVIDGLPGNVVDRLALDLNTQYYDDTLNIVTKRNLVKNTMLWYMTAGTPKAVEELIGVSFGAGSLREWWEYGGEPYYFRVRAEVPLTESSIEKFTQIIQNVKNARSHLEAVEVFREVHQPVYLGVGVNQVKRQAVEDTFKGVSVIGHSLNLAVGAKAVRKISIREEV